MSGLECHLLTPAWGSPPIPGRNASQKEDGNGYLLLLLSVPQSSAELTGKAATSHACFNPA